MTRQTGTSTGKTYMVGTPLGTKGESHSEPGTEYPNI